MLLTTDMTGMTTVGNVPHNVIVQEASLMHEPAQVQGHQRVILLLH